MAEETSRETPHGGPLILLSRGAGKVCLNVRQMHAWRTIAIGLAAGGLLGAEIARAGAETFDNAGLSNNWVSTGTFTGQAGIVWTYANARGTPALEAGNPSITLRTLSATNNGWLQSQLLTGGVGRISARVKQDQPQAADCNVCVNGTVVGNYKSSVSGAVDSISFEAFDPASRMPFAADFTLMVSNRLASGSAGAVAVDDLAWEPFRLFVRLDRTGTNSAYVGKDFDVHAQVFAAGQAVAGGWSIAPAFAGAGLEDPAQTNLTLVPAPEDAGQSFTLTYAATDLDGGGYTNQASIQLAVEDDPWRFLDFEGIAFEYETNGIVTNDLNGMNWKFFNVRAGNTTNDHKLGTTSARFRHSSSTLPAWMESQDMYDGIGTFSLHYSYYGASNRTVTFELQVRADGEDDWTPVPDGTFNVNGHADITNSEFTVDVQQAGQRYVRLITTGNAGEIANIDDVRIRPASELLPRLAWSGDTNAPLGRETVLDFTLRNAEAIPRTWDCSLAPSNANAAFEVLPDQNLRLRFSPADTNEWGEYAATVSASIAGAVAGATSLAIRVVSAPTFDLAPAETNIVATNRVDVRVTNVVLHGGGTDWTTEWTAAPAFAHAPTTTNKTRFLINTGTTEADAGPHALTAVLTDSGTGVRTTNAVLLTVTGSGGSPATNEIYGITSFGPTNLVVSGKVGRVFIPFGLADLTAGADESNWVWRGTAITNADGSDVTLELPELPDPRLFFYGVKVREAP